MSAVLAPPPVAPLDDAPKAGMTEGEAYDRWRALWCYLIDAGCCRMCAVGFALQGVEYERGNRWTTNQGGCAKEPATCKARATAAWKDRPKKGTP